jgi:hypothetical protein
VLRCIQMIQFRTQSSGPALCRVSTESGKACARAPWMAGSSPAKTKK